MIKIIRGRHYNELLKRVGDFDQLGNENQELNNKLKDQYDQNDLLLKQLKNLRGLVRSSGYLKDLDDEGLKYQLTKTRFKDYSFYASDYTEGFIVANPKETITDVILSSFSEFDYNEIQKAMDQNERYLPQNEPELQFLVDRLLDDPSFEHKAICLSVEDADLSEKVVYGLKVVKEDSDKEENK